ncbi:MAG: ECF transporter S component, partial [Sedimentibacter sp.]
LVAILPRIFIGIVPYYVYVVLKKVIKSKTASLLIAGASGALTNTGLVIFMLYLIYNEDIVRLSTEFGIGTTFAAFAIFLVTTSSLIECSVAGIGTVAVVNVYDKINK